MLRPLDWNRVSQEQTHIHTQIYCFCRFLSTNHFALRISCCTALLANVHSCCVLARIDPEQRRPSSSCEVPETSAGHKKNPFIHSSNNRSNTLKNWLWKTYRKQWCHLTLSLYFFHFAFILPSPPVPQPPLWCSYKHLLNETF